MKNKTFLILFSVSLLSSFKLMAQFVGDGVNTWLLHNNDKVGIGVPQPVVPAAKLHVSTTAAGQDAFRVQVANTTRFWVPNNGGASVGAFVVPPAAGLYVSGNAGFGTNIPAAKVQISHNSGAANPQLLLYESEANDFARLQFKNANSNNNFTIAGFPAAAPGAAKLHFNFNNPATNSIMTVQGDGKVGINNTAPPVELSVNHIPGGFGNSGFRLTNTGSNNYFWTFHVSNMDGDMVLTANGNNVGVFDHLTGVYTPSDKRLKKDIEGAGSLLPKIMQLNVQKYHFIRSKSGELKHYGMIAQDVQKIFPEVVKHSVADDGSSEFYAMNYSAFGVIAIKGIQEMQQTIEEQQQKITSLEDRITKLETALASVNNNSKSSPIYKELAGVTLDQNVPNPFNQATAIHYKIPPGAKADLVIADANGRMVKTMQAPASGKVQINAYELTTGTYTYTLIINGQAAASRKMVILK